MVAIVLVLALSGTVGAQELPYHEDGTPVDSAPGVALSAAAVTDSTTYIEFGNPPDGSNCFPFGCAIGFGTHYQQVYNASFFSGPGAIETIYFFNTQFPPASFFEADYEIRLSTTSKAVNGLDLGNLSNNIGSDEALFYAAHLSGPTGTLISF